MPTKIPRITPIIMALVLSHLWNSSYREATCSAVPCKPMQHLPNPTFDFTVD